MRRALPLIASAALLAALTACSSSSPTPTASSTPAASAADVDVCATKSGSASDAVSVSGDFGAEPTVTFDKGIDAKTTERTTVIEGTGEKVEEGASANVAFTIYNGTTGKKIQSGGYTEGQSVTFAADASKYLVGLAKTLGCTTVGSRVAAVIPASEGFGDQGATDLGVEAGQSLVLVVDVQSLAATRAWGADQPAPEGMPKVTLADDGTPSVALPSTDAPTEFQLGVLKKGDGEVVPDGATVTVQYLGVQWDTGETFDQSWGSAPATFSLDGVVPGFAQAIAGQTVGSQVIAVLPPSLAYGEAGADNSNPLAGKTLVFVVDILGVG